MDQGGSYDNHKHIQELSRSKISQITDSLKKVPRIQHFRQPQGQKQKNGYDYAFAKDKRTRRQPAYLFRTQYCSFAPHVGQASCLLLFLPLEQLLRIQIVDQRVQFRFIDGSVLRFQLVHDLFLLSPSLYHRQNDIGLGRQLIIAAPILKYVMGLVSLLCFVQHNTVLQFSHYQYHSLSSV